jgi:hypothetical protein
MQIESELQRVESEIEDVETEIKNLQKEKENLQLLVEKVKLYIHVHIHILFPLMKCIHLFFLYCRKRKVFSQFASQHRRVQWL